MDTDFSPTGDNRLRSILDAVVQEGDAAEYLGLEAKSDIDPNKKGLGIAKITKFILGMSNRMPEVAALHFKGFGVMVIGAEKSNAQGIPKGLEAHDLAARLAPYLGADGPRWDLARLSVSQDNEVLFILVDPPSDGQPPYLCCKDFQPDKATDRKAGLVDGDIYVRDKSQTRKAKSHEVKALLRRALSGQDPEVTVTVRVGGAALYVLDEKSVMRAWIEDKSKEWKEKRAQQEKVTPTRSILFEVSRANAWDQDEARQHSVQQRILDFEKRAWNQWPKGLSLLKAATATPITFTVEPGASYLANPQLIVTVHDARGLDPQDPKDVEAAEILPPVDEPQQNVLAFSRSVRQGSRPMRRRMEVEWEDTSDGCVRIVLSPEALRPSTPWTSRDDELVIVSTDPEAKALKVSWELTAEGVAKKITDSTTLPVRRVDDARTLLGEFLRARR